MKKDKNLQWLATTKGAIKRILEIDSTIKGNSSLQLPDILVLLYILNGMDYDNKIKLPTQKEIGEEIGLTARRISMAITKLKNFLSLLSFQKLKPTI